MTETGDPPDFTVRRHGDGLKFVIDIRWADGTTEQLHGLFDSRQAAEKWIAEDSASALDRAKT